MCLIIPPIMFTTYLIYINSILQAITIYLMAYYYDGWCTSKYKLKVNNNKNISEIF